MKLESCRQGAPLHIVYQGTCKSGMNQCNLLSCSLGQECAIDKQGITSCVCPDYCEPIVRPVCASDGITYNNLCEMKRQACKARVKLTPSYIGTCGKPFITFAFPVTKVRLTDRFPRPVQSQVLQPPLNLCRGRKLGLLRVPRLWLGLQPCLRFRWNNLQEQVLARKSLMFEGRAHHRG